MIPTKTIQLDFWRHPTDILHLVQGEADGRQVRFKITDNGSVADLTGFIAIFAIKKPDGNVVVNSATITEAELGIVETTISSQVVTTAGNAHAELHLMKEGQLSKSFRIVTKVAPGVDIDGIAPSVSEFNALQTLIGQAETVISIADTDLWPEVVENAQYFSDLAGAGRTVETVKGNADDIALKANADDLANLAGLERTTETVKANADEIAAVEAEIETARDGAATLGARLDGTDAQLAETENKLVKPIPAKNLFNLNAGVGLLANPDIAVGSKQLVVANASYIAQKIEISPLNDYTVYGARHVTLVDADNIIVYRAAYLGRNTILTILKTNIPPNAKFMWITVPVIDKNTAQVEIGTVKTIYEAYVSVADLSVNGQDIEAFKKFKETSETDAYNLEIANRVIEELKNTTSLLAGNLNSMLNQKNGKVSSQQTITLKNPDRHKLILHLHDYANTGFDTQNDVFLPHAESDFSDVRIKTAAGDILPYHVTYKGNIDIVADSRLGQNRPKIFINSNGDYITGTRGNNDNTGLIYKSSDKGVTWETLISTGLLRKTDIVYIDANDVLYFTIIEAHINGKYKGDLYRSEYPYTSHELVLNTGNDGAYTAMVLNTNMVQHPDGELFLGAYQNEYIIRIFKSSDNGLTWTLNYVDNSGVGQHIHNMHIDISATPPAIYAGCDVSGEILKSTDKGATWVNLRSLNPAIPKSTDYGIIYSDPSGYRLLGGETSIWGGYSIVKTTDDLNYVPVLSAGSGVYAVEKINGILFAGGCGTSTYRSGQLFMSKDDGDTWELVYSTAPILEEGASDGFRNISKMSSNELIIQCQSLTKKALRVTANENHYAEILVDVPANTNGLIVESGYLCSNKIEIYNDSGVDENEILNFPLNEKGEYVREAVSGTIFKIAQREYTDDGKHISYYDFKKSGDNKSTLLSSLTEGFVMPLDATPANGLTLSFWGRISKQAKIYLLRNANSYLHIDEHRLRLFSTVGETPTLRVEASYTQPIWHDTFCKHDIVFDVLNSQIRVYKNGFLVRTFDLSLTVFAELLNGLKQYRILKAVNYDPTDCIQHFKIYSRALSQEEIYESFHSRIEDNV